jgi:hypothetical protein
MQQIQQVFLAITLLASLNNGERTSSEKTEMAKLDGSATQSRARPNRLAYANIETIVGSFYTYFEGEPRKNP